MATTRKSQPDRKSRRQKQPATIDLEANPPEVPETEAEAAGAFVFADEATATSGDDPENKGSGESASEETAVDAATMQASEAGEPARGDKRGVVGTLIQAAIAAVVGGGVALGGANLMGKLGVPGLPEGADPAAIARSQEDVASLKAQLESLQQRVEGGSSVATDALSARIEALEAGPASGGESLAGELEAAKAASDAALRRSEALEAQLAEIKTALLENGAEGGNGAAAALSGFEERLAALETGAGKLSADLEARLEQLAAQAPAADGLEAAIGENRAAIAGLKSQVEAVSTQISEKILPSMQQVEAAAAAAVSGQKIARSVSARALSNVLEQGGAFSAELASAEALAGGSPEFDSLRAIAEKGVQTPAQLLAGFDAVANRILTVESRPQEDAGIVARFMASARSLVVVRPAGPVEGNSAGAILSRVEAALKGADSEAALRQWESLPQEARQLGAEWEQGLRDRVEAESLLGAIVEKLSAGQG